MKTFNYVSIFLLSYLSFGAHAYSVRISLGVSVNEVSNLNTDAQVSCVLTHADTINSGVSYITLVEGEYNGNVEVAIEASKPLASYQGVNCEIQLCQAQRLDACSTPISSSSYNSSFNGNAAATNSHERLVYDETAPNRIQYQQSYADSLVMVTPPPSYQLSSGQNAESKQSTNKSSSGSNNKSSGKNTLAGAASALNSTTGYTELALSLADAVIKKNGIAIAGLVLNTVGVGTNEGFGAFDSDIVGAIGDTVGFGFSLVGAAVGGTALTTVGAAALPVAGALSAGVSLGTKLDKALNEPLLQLLEATVGYDDEDTEEYKGAVAAMKKRKEKQQEDANNTTDSNVGSGRISSDRIGSEQPADTVSDREAGDYRGAQPPASDPNDNVGDAGKDTAGAGDSGATQPENTAPPTGGSGGTDAQAAENQDTATGGNTADTSGGQNEQGGQNTQETETNENQTANHATTTVAASTSSETDSNDYSYAWVTQDDNGDFVSAGFTDCEGGNCVDTYFDQTGAPTGETREYEDDRNQAPENGEHDTWVANSNTDSEEESSDTGGGDTDSSTSDDSDDDSGEDCEQEAEGCSSDSEEEPSDDEEAEAESSDTSNDSTPTPDGDDNMREGLAWAMKNPDNPFAQSILKQAADAISERSGGCLTGCAEDEGDGGVKWAMNNPDNPAAQEILSAASQMIDQRSGAGQVGGPSDNPENQPIGDEVTEAELIQLEFIVSGGGLVDPPEDSGAGSDPNDPDTPVVGGQPITGGNPASDMTVHTNGGVMIGSGDGSGDPDDPENGTGEIQIDEGRLRSGVTR